MQSVLYVFLVLTNIYVTCQFVVKFYIIKFYEDSLRGTRALIFLRTDRRTDDFDRNSDELQFA